MVKKLLLLVLVGSMIHAGGEERGDDKPKQITMNRASDNQILSKKAPSDIFVERLVCAPCFVGLICFYLIKHGLENKKTQ